MVKPFLSIHLCYGYTQARFLEQAEITTKNSKILYFLLKPFENKGYVCFNIDNFMHQTGQQNLKLLPRGFIKPAVKELKKIYPFMQWEYEREAKGRGNKRITKIHFYFAKDNVKYLSIITGQNQMTLDQAPNYTERQI